MLFGGFRKDVGSKHAIATAMSNLNVVNALPENFLPLPGHAVDAKGKITKTTGTALADILKLPKVWPPV